MNMDTLFRLFPDLVLDSATQSVVVPHESLLDVVNFLMNDDAFCVDYVSNATNCE